jgi:hypothetical protein
LSAAKLPQDLATGLSFLVVSKLFFLLRFGEFAPLPGTYARIFNLDSQTAST